MPIELIAKPRGHPAQRVLPALWRQARRPHNQIPRIIRVNPNQFRRPAQPQRAYGNPIATCIERIFEDHQTQNLGIRVCFEIAALFYHGREMVRQRPECVGLYHGIACRGITNPDIEKFVKNLDGRHRDFGRAYLTEAIVSSGRIV